MKRIATLVAMIVVLLAGDSAQAGPIRNWIKNKRPGIVVKKSAAAGACTAASCGTAIPATSLKK